MEIYIPDNNVDGTTSASYVLWTKVLRPWMLEHVGALPMIGKAPRTDNERRLQKWIGEKKAS